MRELKPCHMTTEEAISVLQSLADYIGISFTEGKVKPKSGDWDVQDACILAISALRRAQPANEPLTCEGQWMETASDNTDCVLAYADGIYCVTDADGHVICEFIRKPEPEGRAAHDSV